MNGNRKESGLRLVVVIGLLEKRWRWKTKRVIVETKLGKMGPFCLKLDWEER